MKSANALSILKSVLAISLGLAYGAAMAQPQAATQAQGKEKSDTTVVLVHGAFADGSSWNKIIPLLQAKGLKVVSVQNPLTSLSDDVAATKRVIDAQIGRVVLVGHSWGGTVITQAGNDDKVSSLVYVAAFAPSEGQSVADLGKDYPTPPGFGKLKSDDGFLTLTEEGIQKDFAQDLPAVQTKLMAVTQGPVRAANFEEKVAVASWKNKPSWYIVATKDHMIQPALQTAMAKKIGATTVSLPTSHVPMASAPKDVAAVIIAAAEKQ